MPSQTDIVAAAIANARGGRRGMPPITNVLAILPQKLVDEVRDEAEAVLSALKESAWQPIETAPKTTKARLVWCPERQNTYIVSWAEFLPGWVFFGGGGRELREEPTHWRPLPDPPAESDL